jgi:hypothetical protein
VAIERALQQELLQAYDPFPAKLAAKTGKTCCKGVCKVLV